VAIVELVFGLEDQVVAVVIILAWANEVVVHCGQQLDVGGGTVAQRADQSVTP
jgi:hypothetical protein